MIRAKLERVKQNKSQSDIARLTGMHVTSISQIENGHLRPYPGQIAKLAEALKWKGDPIELFEKTIEDGTCVTQQS